jgi:hypothetical protein
MNNSPREDLLSAFAALLGNILQVNGYLTNSGQAVTLEPTPVLAETAAEFVTVVWSRQQRATDPALVRTHRLTTVQVIAKVPAGLADAQARLDAITTDIEVAMDRRQTAFPAGYQYPQYQQAEPLVPQPHTAGWIGVSITYTSHIPIRRPAA